MNQDAGDSGFAAWYETEHAGLLMSITLLCGDIEVARDVTAESFARALERWDRVSVMDSPGGWTYRVAVNLLKRRHRTARREHDAAGRYPAAVVSALPDEDLMDLFAAVRGLAPRARLAVVLRYVGDFTEAEVARIMGVAPGTAAATLSAARKQLAATLAGDGLELEGQQ